ncbi:uncharacterized protein LOC144104106 [Amblyomma americanum]
MEYTLVGFSTELDWRPLHFLKPLPMNRVCGACGLVRPKTALLPCCHALCELCYGQCAEERLHACPLDGYECQDEDVDWREFRVDELLRREVKCWNHGTGCDYVAPASRIGQHFRRDCGYHSVLCPKCSVIVPCCRVIPHLKYGLCDSKTPATSEGQLGYKSATDLDSCLKGTFEKGVGEAKESQGKIAFDSRAHGDRLNEISHAVNSVKEVRKHLVRVEVAKRQGSFTQIVSKIDASSQELKHVSAAKGDTLNLSKRAKRSESEKTATRSEAVRTAAQENDFSQNTVHRIKNILRHSGLNKALCVFSVKNVKSLCEIAMKRGAARYESGLVYLRGYNLSPGVCLMSESGSLKLCAWIRLYKGYTDDVLQWPFQHRIKLGAMHPTKCAERVFVVTGSPSLRCFQRPIVSSGVACYFTQESLDVDDLIAVRYVENDRLHVMFELLP